MNGISARLGGKLPVAYPFYFIDGGAAMVVLPEDKVEFDVQSEQSAKAQRTAACICARLLANIAMGRDVKQK